MKRPDWLITILLSIVVGAAVLGFLALVFGWTIIWKGYHP